MSPAARYALTSHSFMIRATASPGGHLSRDGSLSAVDRMGVWRGHSVTYSWGATLNHHVASVLVDGESVPSDPNSGTYVFENVTAPHTLRVEFEAD